MASLGAGAVDEAFEVNVAEDRAISARTLGKSLNHSAVLLDLRSHIAIASRGDDRADQFPAQSIKVE